MAVRNWLAALKALARMPAEAAGEAQALRQALERSEDQLSRRQDALERKVTSLSDQLSFALCELRLLVDRQLEHQREIRLLLDRLPPIREWPVRAPAVTAPPAGKVFEVSTLCRESDMASGLYPYWMSRIGFAPLWHRKRWEFMYICQALHERGMLQPGRRGLGFGVGSESLPAAFAAAGCTLTLTDLPPDAAAREGWIETEQHSASLEALHRSYLCPDAVFDEAAEFRFCDMNQIPPDLRDYDFCWSACALEHLGSIEHGLAFIENSVRCLKPGGVAVHTTEFNLSSNEDTVSEGGTVLFRRRDLEALAERLAQAGHRMAPLDLTPGDGVLDRYLDVSPYKEEPHLRLALSGYAATSMGLIVQKAAAP